MKNKAKSLIAILLLLAVLLIEPLHLNIVTAQQSITGTQDDTLGVWLFSAGTTVPAGAPTDDIIKSAIYYDLLEYIGDSPEEVYDFDWGLSEPTPGQEDTTLAEVIEGLSAIDDFGMIANSGDDAANFDTGSGGYFEGGFDLALAYKISPDGITADGVVGPNGITNAQEAEKAIEGYEIFIFEDAELSGMIVTLSNKLGLSITFSLADLQVDPPTPNAADDTMIAIDLDSMTEFDGTYIDEIRIQDDGITQSRTDTGDTTLEIDAIATRTIECTVNFYTDPVGSNFNITFEGKTYVNGDIDTFPYGTSGLATADCPPGWVFDHWEIVGNVALDPDEYANPVTFTITCGGDLKAIFRPVECSVTFYTDPSDIGSITFEGDIYFNEDSNTFPYGTSGLATANVPVGWMFDHWEATGNVELSSTTTNPTTVTVVCGGTLKAVFTQTQCTVDFYTDPSSVGSITFEGEIYFDSDSDTFPYGTSGLATANVPEGYVFDHWEATGNVELSSTTENPTTVTVLCGGSLKAVFTQVECPVTFYTDPSTIGSITFEGDIYFDGDTDTFTYGTSGLATANVPVGWMFDHWVATGNVELSSTTTNPTTVTVVCGGTLKAVFIQIECTVNFYTDPVGSGFNVTFEGDTYFDGDSHSFLYGTSGLATADCPLGWVFDHWEIVGNVALDPDEYANPVTFTITCGGDLKAIFRQEGTGDFGTIGYWKHVFYVWKTGKGTFKDYVQSILEGYIARINAESTVFSENYTLTMESAHDLLWTRDNDMRTRALKQCLASWLNWADDAVTPSQMVDTDYDGHPDMTFGDAMTIAENILRNPNSSQEELEHAKNICDSINNM